MRSLIKALAAGAFAIPVVLGGAGMAFADGSHSGYDRGHDYGDGPSYKQVTISANGWGAESKTVSGFHWDGTAFFYESYKVADHTGAYSYKVIVSS